MFGVRRKVTGVLQAPGKISRQIKGREWSLGRRLSVEILLERFTDNLRFGLVALFGYAA